MGKTCECPLGTYSTKSVPTGPQVLAWAIQDFQLGSCFASMISRVSTSFGLFFFFRRLENWLPRLSSYLESAPTIGQWGPWCLTKAILLCGSSLLQFVPFMVEGLCTWPPSLLRHYSKLSGNPTSWMSPLPHLSSALIQSSVAREKERL